jgi:hypothetical protein
MLRIVLRFACYVVAGGAVAAGGAADEQALFVTQVDGHAVNFGLDHPFEFFARQQPLDPGDELADFALRIGVVQAEHGFEVADGQELLERLAANPLGGGIRGDQRREAGFQLDQLAVKPVVFGVADGGSRQHVIRVVVPANFLRSAH